MPEEVTRYPYKEPTWFIARTSQNAKRTSISPARTSSTRGSPTRNQGPQSLPRTYGVPSGQNTRRNTNIPRQDYTSSHPHQILDFTSVATLLNNQTHQQPFHTVSSSPRRASIPSTAPISHAWGHRVVLNQAANPNDSSIGHTSGRVSRSCAHRQITEPITSLSVTVRPLVMDGDQRVSQGSARSVSPSTLRVTSQSTYRLVPVDNNARSLHQNPPTSPFRHLTTSLASMAPPPTSLGAERYSCAAATDTVNTKSLEEPELELESRQTLEDMVEGPEASESRIYVRGRFIYTPEETEINDNSCISFAY